MRIRITRDVPPSAEGVAPRVGETYEVEEVIRLKSNPSAVFLYAISVEDQVIGVSPSEGEEFSE